MKTNTLARVNAIFGLIAGIVLLLAPLVMFMIAVGVAAVTEDPDATDSILRIFIIIFSLVKIAVLVLGIVSIVYYKDDWWIPLFWTFEKIRDSRIMTFC